MKREEAIAVLKEIAESRFSVSWVSLVNKELDDYEIHIKPNLIFSASLDQIVQKHNLALKEVKGILIIHES
jgi:hypothetical protein